MVDLRASREDFGKDICLKGNLDPVAWMLRSSPETILAKCRQDITIGGTTGYILSPGCELAPETPDENLRAMVEAAHGYGH